ADRNRSHWSTSKTPSYTKSVSWQHHLNSAIKYVNIMTNKYFYHECFLPVLFGLINVTYSAG
ncbi:hypothetical protein MZE57_07995, partial [Escherichia coli]|nr:hypothetical protein [Escherichia coli]